MIENKNAAIDALIEGAYGIEFDSTNNKYTFYVRSYFKEFKNAVNDYIINLESGKESISLLETVLANRN